MFDVFISHAGEEKDSVARPLAQGLQDAGLRVWYDEFSLKLGDSLRRSIEKGLSDSRYGVVILSPNFFKKKWPQEELDGLFAKDMNQGKTILPIWHQLGASELLELSPIMAGRVAAKTADGMDTVIEKIVEVVEPDSFHLTRGRLTLLLKPKDIRLHTGEWSVKTPVVISNPTRAPLYSAWVKIALSGRVIKSDSIEITPDAPSTGLDGQVGQIQWPVDIVRFDCVDSREDEAVFLMIHTILPQRSRELIISGTTPVQSGAEIKVCSFAETPAEVLQSGERTSLSFTPPETITIKSQTVLLRRV